MGLDDSQRLFAARLVTGEALCYSDGFAEAAHVVVPRPLHPTRPIAPKRCASPPFRACELCPAQCEYRGPALAVIGQLEVGAGLTAARLRLARKGSDPQEVRDSWTALLGMLKSSVHRFDAFPRTEPALSHAAFCLFVHSLARDSSASSANWPPAVARRLGLDDPKEASGAF